MKKLYFIIVALLAGLNLYGEPFDVRATCRSHGLTINAYVTPFEAPILFPFANNTIQLLIVFSLPANGVTDTLLMPLPVSTTAPLGGSPSLTKKFIFNDRFNYSYQVLFNSIPAQGQWNVGLEKLAMTVTFSAAVVGIHPRLDNLLTSGAYGGSHIFYVEINGNQRSDTEGVPFYTGNGTLGTYSSGDQWVQPLLPLPVKLLAFSAEKSGEKSAMLNWSTASESNSSYFAIERSKDQVNWTTVGQVQAAGNSQIVKNYQYLDNNVYNGVSSKLTVYYRLKMVDLDGSYEYSPIESVNFGNNGRDVVDNVDDFFVYPNPASEGIHVEWDADQVKQPTSLEFYDLAGKLVYTEKVEEQTDQKYVDFTKTNIQSGLVLMRVMSGDESINYKQIVVGKDH